MKRQAYATDLRDKEWLLIAALIPSPLGGGRPAKGERREIVAALL